MEIFPDLAMELGQCIFIVITCMMWLVDVKYPAVIGSCTIPNGLFTKKDDGFRLKWVDIYAW